MHAALRCCCVFICNVNNVKRANEYKKKNAFK